MSMRYQGVPEEDLPELAEMSTFLGWGRIELLADFSLTAHSRRYPRGMRNGRMRLEAVADEYRRIGAGGFC